MPPIMRIMSHIMRIMPHHRITRPITPHHRIMRPITLHTTPHTTPHTMLRITLHITLHIMPHHRTMRHPLLPIVGMDSVIMEKLVIHVYRIALVQIVIIVITRITRLPHGWNVRPNVVIINLGFHRVVRFVVVPNKISQTLQQGIFPYIGPNVRVMYYPFAEMAHVMEGKDVGIVQWIVGHVLHKQVPLPIQLPRQGPVRPHILLRRHPQVQ